MRDKTALWDNMLKSVKREVLPALGCTEPVSLALASAIAASQLDRKIDRIEAKVSANLMKNGMGVTVPGTGTQGLYIAAAAGALGGDPEGGLEVLRTLTPEHVIRAKQLIAENRISLSVAHDPRVIYSEATVYSDNDNVRVCIADTHTQVISIAKNGEETFHLDSAGEPNADHLFNFEGVTTRDVYQFVKEVPLESIDFILKAEELNNALSLEGQCKNYGLRIAATLKDKIDRGLLSDDLLNQIVIRTTAASDARMGGASLPAMSNSGSGNQGITATIPVVVVADHVRATREQRVRALMLSHLMAVYIHSKLPKLSAFCAVTTAAMGAASGMAWLLGQAQYESVARSITNMISDITGVICDGASNSCAMKVSTSVSSAFKAVLMALDSIRVSEADGIVCKDVDQSIANLGNLACNCMQQMDAEILKMMLEKQVRTSCD